MKLRRWMLVVLFVLVLSVYLFVAMGRREKFTEPTGPVALIAPEKTVVVQGNGVPDIPIEPTAYDANDESAPSVDGTIDGPRSKFLFAFNECKPECCGSSGGYMCEGGCPCLTDKQKTYFHSFS